MLCILSHLVAQRNSRGNHKLLVKIHPHQATCCCRQNFLSHTLWNRLRFHMHEAVEREDGKPTGRPHLTGVVDRQQWTCCGLGTYPGTYNGSTD